MSLRALASEWTIDSETLTLLVQLAAVAALYLAAVAHGNRNGRRRRRWPRQRTVRFMAGLAVAAIDLCSGIGAQADSRLSAHMLEHTILWMIVAPLLAAGAPVRLAFHALPRAGRRRLARRLHSRPVTGLTGPVGSALLFSTVMVLTQIPAVYGLTLTNEPLHEAEHGLYLLTTLLVWAPLIGADPLPHRPGPRAQLACMLACMLPMMLVALWLTTRMERLSRETAPRSSIWEASRATGTTPARPRERQPAALAGRAASGEQWHPAVALDSRLRFGCKRQCGETASRRPEHQRWGVEADGSSPRARARCAASLAGRHVERRVKLTNGEGADPPHHDPSLVGTSNRRC